MQLCTTCVTNTSFVIFPNLYIKKLLKYINVIIYDELDLKSIDEQIHTSYNHDLLLGSISIGLILINGPSFLIVM